MSPQSEYKIKSIREQMIRAAANNNHLKADIIKFANEVNTVIKDLERETLDLELALISQIKSERVLLNLMEAYGIDLSHALRGPDSAILSRIELSKTGTVMIPEKLIPFIYPDLKP